MARQKLTDVLSEAASGGNGWINSDWSKIAPAPEFGPVPPGEYEAHLIGKDGAVANTGTPSVKLTFSILNEGPFKGRLQWYDIWITDKNQGGATRDFLKLGIQSKDDANKPLPTLKRLRCRIDVVIRKDNDGNPFNKVASFKVVGLDDLEPDPFAPEEGGAAS